MHSPAANSDVFPPTASRSIWRGMLTGLIPLGLLAVLGALSIGVTALARQLSLSHGFPVEQQAVVLTACVALVITVAAFALACVAVLRCIGRWQRMGEAVCAAGALWALGITALIVVLPVLLAVLIPQHPAPVL